MKPTILCVDDDPQVLSAVERDLVKKYAKNFRILKAQSGKEALQLLGKLKLKNITVALFLVDQRMPEMTGTQFLMEADKIYPDAKKVLLTAYADTEAAIESINQIGLDHYLLKPWDPPDIHLYPVLDELLDDWLANTKLPYDGIKVVGNLWSPATHNAKEFLARHQIPYLFLDVEKDEQALQLSNAAKFPPGHYPLVFFPDGSFIVEPTNRQIAEKVGLQTKAKKPFYDLVIIGAGPAGLAAAVYAASEGLEVLMIEKEATGGQAGASSNIENYLGFPQGVSGSNLARRAVLQAKRFGTEILTAEEVVGIRTEFPYHFVSLTDKSEISCRTVLISTGVATRMLNAKGCDKLTGASVYYGAAYSEAAHYKGKKVLVIGGGNSAGQGALFLARFARSVKLLVRGESLAGSMSKYLITQIEETNNIQVVQNTEVINAVGKKKLRSVTIFNNKTKKAKKLDASAMFIFIGALPRTQFLENSVFRDEKGYIITGQDLISHGKKPSGWNLSREPFLLETNVPGIFAAGDVRLGATNRVASAVGEGAVAVSLIHQYLKTV